MKVLSRYTPEERPDFSFRKVGNATTPAYALFDGVGYFGSAAVGPDIIDGSSWGIPVGTNPTNLINELLNATPLNNPFILEKFVWRIFDVDPVQYPFDPLFGAPVVNIYSVKANGELDIETLNTTRTYIQEDQEGINHEYKVNRLIDGNCILVLQGSRNIRFEVSFFTKSQNLIYNAN